MFGCVAIAICVAIILLLGIFVLRKDYFALYVVFFISHDARVMGHAV